MNRLTTINRALLTAMLLASWTVTTSHCALAAATSAISTATAAADQPMADGCPMHQSKPTKQQGPAKKKGCADLLCCKNLPAAKPLAGISICKPTVFLVAVHSADGFEQLASRQARQPVLLLDTGPPVPDHLVEFVLRRSIPAHAPPAA